MGAPEKEVMVRVLSALNPSIDRMFRINSGLGWIGKVLKHTGEMIVLANPRPLHAAPAGWPDLFGWKTVTITSDMVGRKIAVARAVEIKAGNDRLRDEQLKFRKMFESMGGLYEIEGD